MVKRNYSRLAYAAPITLAVALLATQLPLALLTLNQPGSCNAAACNDVMWRQATEAVLQIVGALFLGAWGWYTRRESVRNDQRRQAAARGEGVRIPLNEALLGDERPPLTLPVTIRLKLVWRDWFIAAGASLLLMQCLVPPVLALTYHPDPGQWSTLAVVAVAEASLIIFVLLLMGLGALLGRETLVVTLTACAAVATASPNLCAGRTPASSPAWTISTSSFLAAPPSSASPAWTRSAASGPPSRSTTTAARPTRCSCSSPSAPACPSTTCATTSSRFTLLR